MDYHQLEPKKVFAYFKNISDIPRGSGNEEAVAKYVYDTVTALGHDAVMDDANNVFVRAKAAPGYENRAPIMMQGHLECGLLSEKLPGLDCVSIGPNMQDIHTSREKLHIASTERTWQFLLEILKNL